VARSGLVVSVPLAGEQVLSGHLDPLG
jgi:hypothetical protein